MSYHTENLPGDKLVTPAVMPYLIGCMIVWIPYIRWRATVQAVISGLCVDSISKVLGVIPRVADSALEMGGPWSTVGEKIISSGKGT
jgi:hypothetical protein